jgi:hypothetical protein
MVVVLLVWDYEVISCKFIPTFFTSHNRPKIAQPCLRAITSAGREAKPLNAAKTQ